MMKCLVCRHVFADNITCPKCGAATDVNKNVIRQAVLYGVDTLIETNRPALEELAK